MTANFILESTIRRIIYFLRRLSMAPKFYRITANKEVEEMIKRITNNI